MDQSLKTRPFWYQKSFQKQLNSCEAVQAQFMSRGVGEMAAWRAEQREADVVPTHLSCWRCKRRFKRRFSSALPPWKAGKRGKWCLICVWFAWKNRLVLWAGGSKASRNFGCIPDLTFFLQVNIHVFFPFLFAISMFGCLFNAMFVTFCFLGAVQIVVAFLLWPHWRLPKKVGQRCGTTPHIWGFSPALIYLAQTWEY